MSYRDQVYVRISAAIFSVWQPPLPVSRYVDKCHSPVEVVIFQGVLALLAEKVQGQRRITLVSLQNTAVLKRQKTQRHNSPDVMIYY